MSDTYTKLFSSITESTVWGESYPTRIVWITMLAMADARGNVYGSVPGLARRANVTLSEAQEALSAFYAADPHSRTKDSDGRRVEEIDGGWRLINHAKYAAIRSAEERREYKRQWDRENRGCKEESDNPTEFRQNPTNPTGATTPTPTPTQDQKHSSSAASQPAADRRAARIAQVAADAVAAYNTSKLPKLAGGLLPNVSPTVGMDNRRKQVARCIKVASEIAKAETGSPELTPDFWAAYFAICAADDFLSGRSGGGKAHANWLPDFEFLTRPDQMLRAYEKAPEQ